MIKYLKILVMSVLGLILAAMAVGYLIIKPKEDRSLCASNALDYVKQESENSTIRYQDAERDRDYKFVYDHCIKSKGYR
jgi:capsular polysaccharide biosynthesis protein